MSKIYNLFISHAWDYNDDYYRLINMLESDDTFNFKNYSVPEHDALEVKTNKELEDGLRRQIAPSSILLIIAGMYYNHRKWIQKEIEIAEEMGKTILVIEPRGSEQIPLDLQKYNSVKWNSNSIILWIKYLCS